MRKLSYLIAFFIVAALVYEIKENEDSESSKASIKCLSQKATAVRSVDRVHLDLLWDETISYLNNYAKTLESKSASCKTRLASTLSFSGDRSKPKECLDRHYDVVLMVQHLNQIVANKDAAKKCFDPSMSQVYPKSFRGFTPHKNMKSFSSVAKWLNRETFQEHYGEKTEVYKKLSNFANGFLENLKSAETSAQWYDDPTIDNYPHLWASAPWIPMYVDKFHAGPTNFRGGYAYAEILGPWGMLRIDEINGTKFQGEVGLTNQKGSSFYPPHYHYAGELYIALSKPNCPKKHDRYLLIPKDTMDPYWDDNFESINKLSNNVIYIKRNFIHAFEIASCESDPNHSLVAAWSRTIVRDDLDQTTFVCGTPTNEDIENFSSTTRYSCGKIIDESH